MYKKYGNKSSEAASIHVRQITVEWLLGLSSETDPQNRSSYETPSVLNLCRYLEGQNEREAIPRLNYS